MGSAERRQRESTETRDMILDAARDLFVELGYEATSMRAIADRIEYTPTAIYHHFANKEALLAELCAQDFLALGLAFQRIGHVQDPVERIERSGRAYVEFALAHPKHYEFMFMVARPPHDHANGPVKGDPSEDAYAFLREAAAEAIAEDRFRHGFDDPDEVAQILWGTLHGIISLRITKADDPWVEFKDPREATDLACDAMLRGMLR
ncbi:MAG TPA: TetR/AcrR family transcriptional regulator [Longimicrobiales bacterium]|nr:TetR/AcrR family transcriptional regulator [Longimicrobiales bacterium]